MAIADHDLDGVPVTQGRGPIDSLDPLQVARRIVDCLEDAGVCYALGGALAYGFWGPPRGTLDVDLDVFEVADRLEVVFQALVASGVTVDEVEARLSVDERGDFRGSFQGMRVDVFVAFNAYHEAVRERRVQRQILGRPMWILSAEDTIIFKVLFDRGKDWIDLERLIALRKSSLDRDYIRGWLRQWVDSDDGRLARLEALWAKP